jgi:hypothetical protein
MDRSPSQDGDNDNEEIFHDWIFLNPLSLWNIRIHSRLSFMGSDLTPALKPNQKNNLPNHFRPRRSLPDSYYGADSRPSQRLSL